MVFPAFVHSMLWEISGSHYSQRVKKGRSCLKGNHGAHEANGSQVNGGYVQLKFLIFCAFVCSSLLKHEIVGARRDLTLDCFLERYDELPLHVTLIIPFYLPTYYRDGSSTTTRLVGV